MAQNEQGRSVDDTLTSAASRLAAKRAAKAAAKAAQRGTSAVPNAVAEGVTAVQSWYDKSARVILVATGTIAVCAAAWFGGSAYFAKKNHEAAQLLGAAIDTSLAPISNGDDPAAANATDESYASVSARAEQASTKFRNMVNDFAGAPGAPWAMLGEANSLRALGKHADAQRLYEVLIARADLEPFLQVRALEGLGFSFETQQKYAEAALRFERIGKLDNGTYKAPADYHRARMLVAMNQPKQASDLLEALIKAERARPAAEGGLVFESVVSDAETLLSELSIVLGTAKPRAESSSMVPPHAGPTQGGDNGISKEIINALRKQLASGKAGKGLTKEMLDNLERQAQDGKPKASGSKPPAAPQPQGTAQ